jgi:mannose-6-phosphate isomerase-like protein (cupin superfamily)
MKGYLTNIEEVTKNNTDFRRVLYTGKYSQLVVMSLKMGEEIGNEVHTLDQFIRVEGGNAKAILNNGETIYELSDGFAVIIPAGTWHNILNTGDMELKLYTLYSPPEHKDKVVEPSKQDVMEEHFDGATSEQ